MIYSPVFSVWIFSAKQGHYWYYFLKRRWYDAVLDWGLNPGPPAVEASTIPLGYRGGCSFLNHFISFFLLFVDVIVFLVSIGAP